jgi:hypothetical protein
VQQTPEINKLKEERFILNYNFRGFGPWSADSIVSGPLVRQTIMEEGMGTEPLTSWQLGGREKHGTRCDPPKTHP